MSRLLQHANSSLPRTEEERKQIILDAAAYYGQFMTALGYDWKNDPNSKETPLRVAKSFVNDLAQGCFIDAPKITAFDNVDGYDGIVFEGNIDLKSICSHHHLPFIGKAHVAYIPSKEGKIIGLSKLNRIVEYFARRPQVQENLTTQIHDYIDKMTEANKGVAVMLEAKHMCACVRGVRHDGMMMTSKMSGAFINDPATRNEFYHFIDKLK